MIEAYPFHVPIPTRYLAWSPRLAWLREQFGDDDNRWCVSAHYYWFRNEADYLMFLLRWNDADQ